MTYWLIKSFATLTTTELYGILALRNEVFVVEQNCAYQDLDYKDQKAMHLLGIENGQIQAYSRLFAPGDYFSDAAIGRIITSPSIRRTGYGKQLMKKSIGYLEQQFPEAAISISAQLYLKAFYETFGFRQIGTPYPEDGIPHIKMIRPAK